MMRMMPEIPWPECPNCEGGRPQVSLGGEIVVCDSCGKLFESGDFTYNMVVEYYEHLPGQRGKDLRRAMAFLWRAKV